MTINDAERFVNSLWDWGFLDDCFDGTRIKVSDIDGIVERRGKFLFIECKGTGTPVTTGQKIMHDSLLKTGVFVVLIIWGDANKPTSGVAKFKDMTKEYLSFSLEDIREFVRRWYAWANKTKVK